MIFRFGQRSIERMDGIHPKLLAVANDAISASLSDMTVPDMGGMRTLEQQKSLVAKGVSKTINSMHVKQKDGYGHAIDLIPYVNGKAIVNALTTQDREHWYDIVWAMKYGAEKNGLSLRWGGRWFDPKINNVKYDIRNITSRSDIEKLIIGNSFMDWAHYEII